MLHISQNVQYYIRNGDFSIRVKNFLCGTKKIKKPTTTSKGQLVKSYYPMSTSYIHQSVNITQLLFWSDSYDKISFQRLFCNFCGKPLPPFSLSCILKIYLTLKLFCVNTSIILRQEFNFRRGGGGRKQRKSQQPVVEV